MVRAGDRMSDDCLQIILEACDGCPFTLHAASQVSRQWRSVSQRPSVVKQNDYATFSFKKMRRLTPKKTCYSGEN